MQWLRTALCGNWLGYTGWNGFQLSWVRVGHGCEFTGNPLSCGEDS